MSQNTKPCSTTGDTAPLLAPSAITVRDSRPGWRQTTSSLFGGRDAASIVNEITAWPGRVDCSHTAYQVDHAILRHLMDKMNRGLERGTTIRSKLTQPTQSQLRKPTKLNIKRVLQVIDDNLDSDILGTKPNLRSKLSEIDGRIWLYQTAQSGSNGGAVRGYVNDSYRPLDWVDVKSLRDEIIPAVERLTTQRRSQLDQTRYSSHSYGTVADDEGADVRNDDGTREGSDDEATFTNVL